MCVSGDGSSFAVLSATRYTVIDTIKKLMTVHCRFDMFQGFQLRVKEYSVDTSSWIRHSKGEFIDKFKYSKDFQILNIQRLLFLGSRH